VIGELKGLILLMAGSSSDIFMVKEEIRVRRINRGGVEQTCETMEFIQRRFSADVDKKVELCLYKQVDITLKVVALL
jgi:hypothetical protein